MAVVPTPNSRPLVMDEKYSSAKPIGKSQAATPDSAHRANTPRSVRLGPIVSMTGPATALPATRHALRDRVMSATSAAPACSV